jgi:hypothetical protein
MIRILVSCFEVSDRQKQKQNKKNSKIILCCANYREKRAHFKAKLFVLKLKCQIKK